MPETSPSHTSVVKHSCFHHVPVLNMAAIWPRVNSNKAKEIAYSTMCAPDIAPSLVTSNGSMFHYLRKHRNIHPIILVSIKMKETRSPRFQLVHKLAKMSHSYLSAFYCVTKRNHPGRSDQYIVPHFNSYF